jgi:hypothetical protein
VLSIVFVAVGVLTVSVGTAMTGVRRPRGGVGGHPRHATPPPGKFLQNSPVSLSVREIAHETGHSGLECPRAASGHAAVAPPRSVMKSRRRMSALLPGHSLPYSSNQGCVVHHSKNRPPMSEMGHFRQIDPLPTLSACPLRSDRVRTFAPQRIDAVVESRMGAVAWAMRQRSVSHPRSSNRTCGFPAYGSPTGFIVRHTARATKVGVRGAAPPVPHRQRCRRTGLCHVP